jgi:TPR repeat protein
MPKAGIALRGVEAVIDLLVCYVIFYVAAAVTGHTTQGGGWLGDLVAGTMVVRRSSGSTPIAAEPAYRRTLTLAEKDKLWVTRAHRSVTLPLPLHLAAFGVLLSMNLAAAQQPAQPSVPASTPQSLRTANDAYRKGEEFARQRNFAEALRWYRVAANQGNADAQLALGNLYAQGEGVQQDYGAALLWYRKAAEQGNLEAQDNVGFFYLSGMGVAQDYGEAMRWLRKSAAQGNEVAERNIGIMYLNGLGVPASRDEAIRWLREAAAKGDDDAKNALQLLGAK